MNKEKVRELVHRLTYSHYDNYENTIITWLKQNQSEPVVVGLSDEQLKSLHIARFKDYLSLTDFVNNYYQWAKGENFTQEVKEIPVGLSAIQFYDVVQLFSCDEQEFGENSGKLENYLKTQIFAQQEVKEVVVGLSDEQIFSFMAKYGIHPVVGMNLKEWLKTQTFIQHDDELRSYVEELRNEIITLKSNLQPSWDDAPVSAIGAALFLDFYDETAKTVKSVVIKRFERPQPPAPTVKVGQIWEHSRNGTSYFIASVGKVKLNDVWIESVTYRSNEYGSFTRTLDDFLAKFVRVE